MGLGGSMQMLTIIHLIKVAYGPPMTMLTKIPVMTKGCEEENKLLLIEDHSAAEDILTYEWVYRTRNVLIGATNIVLCQKTSGGFEVNPSYYGKVEHCNTTGILLKNVSLDDSGYYQLQLLREKMEHKESQTILLTVSATPTDKCKPVIRSYSGNVLNCTTHCEYLDLQWIWNKTESVVGNQSVLPISCSWKNEVILCCLQGQAMGCYKGSPYELCTPTIPRSCIENTAGDAGSDIPTVKAPDKSDSNLLGLLTLVIIPVLIVIMCIFDRNKIKPWIICHNRRNKSTQNCDVNTREEALNLLKVKEKPESTLTVEVKEESDSIPTVNAMEEPESTVTVKVIEETETTPNVVVKVQLESTPTVEVKGESNSIPAHLLNETVPLLKEKEAADCNPTQLSEPENTTEVAKNMRELQELRDANICKICFVSKMSMLFIPCSHVATCDTCSISLQKCPVCRASIDEKMKIHYDKSC